jgi:hypothetical protein
VSELVKAALLAMGGDFDSARELGFRSTVGTMLAEALLCSGRYLEVTADAYLALARVLDAVGKSDAAQPAWRKALELYERKGVVPRVAEVKEHLAE